MEANGHLNTPAVSPFRKEATGTHCTGVCVGPIANEDDAGRRKIPVCRKSNPGHSAHTDWTIPVHHLSVARVMLQTSMGQTFGTLKYAYNRLISMLTKTSSVTTYKWQLICWNRESEHLKFRERGYLSKMLVAYAAKHCARGSTTSYASWSWNGRRTTNRWPQCQVTHIYMLMAAPRSSCRLQRSHTTARAVLSMFAQLLTRAAVI
jgi:hypothetical protein